MCEFPAASSTASPLALYDGSVSVSSTTVVPLGQPEVEVELDSPPSRHQLKSRKSLFSLKSKRSKSPTSSLLSMFKHSSSPPPSPPSYEETRIQAAWAKVGIDVTNPQHGPRPHCTPDELSSALDDFFAPRLPKRAK